MNTNTAAAAQHRMTHSELLQLHLKRVSARVEMVKDSILSIDPADKKLANRLSNLQGRLEELKEIQGWLLREMDL